MGGSIEFILIDLELAARAGCRCDADPYPLPHWPKNALEGGRYVPQSDLRMLAFQLLGCLPFVLQDKGRSFRTGLENGSIATGEFNRLNKVALTTAS